mgnify:CR=1 FL=1
MGKVVVQDTNINERGISIEHKVGDKVRIRTDLKKYFIYGVYTFTDEMCTLSGKL